MQPPGRAPGLSFSTPLAAKTPGAGHVLSVGLMKSSMRNGRLKKLLLDEHAVPSGGVVRFTSFCARQANGMPF